MAKYGQDRTSEVPFASGCELEADLAGSDRRKTQSGEACSLGVKQMDRKIVAVFAVALAAASAAYGFELQGFKQVRFGAAREAIAALGFSCNDSASQRLECSSEDTLFGTRSSVRAWFRDGRVSAVRIVALDNKPVDLVAAYTNALGKPKKFTERNGRQEAITVFYWVSKSGTSVSTFTTKDAFPIRNSDTGEERHFASADYLDQTATAALLEQAQKAARSKRDF